MDMKQAEELSQIANHQIKISKRYSKARQKAGIAESELKQMLAPNINSISEGRKNIGVEMAILKFIATDELAMKLYNRWTKYTAIYKGLERIIDSYASKLITAQAIMKFQGQGEKWG